VKWWLPLALIPPVVLLMQFPLSEPIWNALPKLRFLQFPWRWLVVVEARMGIFFAAAVWSAGRRLRWFVISACSAFFVCASVLTGFLLFQRCDYEDSVAGTLDVYRYQVGYVGTDEYAPPGADNELVATELPDACLTSTPSLKLGHGEEGTTPQYRSGCDATFSWSADARKGSAEHRRLTATTSHAGYMVLKLRTYPAWLVKVNGQPVGSLPFREDGLMVIPVPEGPVQITVDWTTTTDVVTGRWLSALALALMAVVFWVERKLSAHGYGAAQGRLTGPRL